MADQDFIPDDQAQDLLAVPNDQVPEEAIVPDPQVPQTSGDAPAFVPEDQFVADEDKYSTPGQMLASLAEGAAESATLGLSAAVERGAGVPAEDVLARAKANPVIHGVGEALGVVVPTLLGDEAAALSAVTKFGDVGAAAAKAAVGGAPERLASRVAGWAGRGAAESALLTGEHVLSEALLGDPNATAEHALTEVGLSAILGGAGGAILGAPAEAGMDLAKKLFGGGEGLLAGFGKLKENADDIAAAADRLGVEPLPGQLSASKGLQDLQSQIAKEPTIVGRQEQAAVDRQFDAIRGATKQALGESTPMTKAEVGDALRQGISQKFEETYKPISDAYEYLKAELKEVPLERKALLDATRGIRNIEGVRVSPSSPEYKLAEAVGEEIRQLSNVTELRQYASALQRRTAGSPEIRYVGNAIKGILADVEESAIEAAAQNLAKAGRISKGELDLLNYTRGAAKAQYKELISQMGEIGDVLGKRRVYGPKDFLDHLADVPAEKIAERLFSKKDSRFLKFFREEFPQQADQLARYQKSVIAEKAFKDGVVSPSKVLSEVGKLEPEVQKFLFTPDDLAKLEDAKTLIESMPKDINPSGTAKAQSLNEALNPFRHSVPALAGELAAGHVGALAGIAAGVVGPEVSSLLKRSLLRGVVSGRPEEVLRHQAIGKLLELTERTTKTVSRAAKAVLTREGAARLTMSRDERDRTAKKLTSLSQDPQKLVDRLAKMTAGMDEHAPNTGAALSATAGRAVEFLASKVPKSVRPSPFSPPIEPSEVQKATFRRYADAVLDPVGVMSRIGDGTLSFIDVEALQTVYPQLYSTMRQAVTEQLSEASRKETPVPYVTRQSLSLFLGAPVDRSLEPTSIAGVQATFGAAPQSQASQGQQGPAGVNPRRSTAALSKVGDRSLTQEQAASARRGKIS